MPADRWCPRCQAPKVPVRGDPDVCLLIVLLIIGIIPGLIYLLIFYAVEPNRCVNCNSSLVPLPSAAVPAQSTGIPAAKPSPAPAAPVTGRGTPGAPPAQHPAGKHFCPYCGNSVDPNAHFCPDCGSSL